MILCKKIAFILKKEINLELIIDTFKVLESTSTSDFNNLCDCIYNKLQLSINSEFLKNKSDVSALFESLDGLEISDFFYICMENVYFNQEYSKRNECCLDTETQGATVNKLKLTLDKKNEIVREFASLIVAYSEGPDKKWPHSVVIRNNNLKKIAQPKVDFALDVGLGTRYDHVTSLEKRISICYLNMLSKITQIKRDYSNSEFSDPLYFSLTKIRTDLCNQFNAHSLVDAYNEVLSNLKD
jgi:hypothetical protein